MDHMFLCGLKDTRTWPRWPGRIDNFIAGIFAGNLYCETPPRINVENKKREKMEENKNEKVGRTFWDCLYDHPVIMTAVLAFILDEVNKALRTIKDSQDKKS